MSNWTELPDSHFEGNGYRNIQRGWKNTETDAEVLIYRVENTGMEDVTDKEFAVQHPLDGGENSHFFDDVEKAESYADDYMSDHPNPEP